MEDNKENFFVKFGETTNIGGGTSDYNQLENLPSINDAVLQGNKTSEELGLQGKLTAGDNITIENGVISATDGTKDYEELDNLPSINNVILQGNKTTEDLGLFDGDFEKLTNLPFVLISEDTSMDIVNETYPGKILVVTEPIVFGLDDGDEGYIELTQGNMIIVGEEYYDNFLICSYGYIQAMTSSGHWKYEFVATTDWVEGSFQPILDSGRNIKTINNQSILGSGNLNIDTALPWTKLNEDINIEDLENGSYVAVEDITFTYGDGTYDVMALNAGDFISIADAQAIVVSSYGFYVLNNVSGVWYANPTVGYNEFDEAVNQINSQLSDLSINKQTRLTAGAGILISNNVISATTGLEIKVVQTLPQTGEPQTLYLVPNATDPTIYDEYVWVNNAFEKIGTTDIDLTGYYTKTEIDTALSDKADKATTYTKAETDTLLNGKQATLTAGQNININANNVISAGIEVLTI